MLHRLSNPPHMRRRRALRHGAARRCAQTRGTPMRYWHGRRGFLHGMVCCVLVGSGALGSCTGDGSREATVGGTISLTAMNAAALSGLTLTFSDGSVFGVAGQPTTLTFGPDG